MAAPEAGVMRSAAKEKVRWLPATVLILGVSLRLFNLGPRNTWYDEISSILFAEKDLPTIVQATAADTMPPLYYFLLHYCLLLGNNLWVARSLSVALGTGMIVLTFVLARRLFGSRVAVIAALLLSLNPFQVYHGQEVRMYTLLGLCQLLAVYFLLRSIDYGGWKNWAGFILSQLAAMYTHNTAFLLLVTVDAFAFGFGLLFWRGMTWKERSYTAPADGNGWGRLRRDPVPFLKELLLANLAVFMLFLPWLVYLPGQLAKVTRAFWTQPAGIVEVFRALTVFTFNLPGPTTWALPILLAVSLFIFVLLAYSFVSALRRGETNFALVFAVSFFVGPVVFALLVSLVRPIFVERVLITSSVLYIVLLAWLIENLRPRLVAAAVFGCLALLSLWSLVSYYQYDAFPRVAFPQLVAYLEGSFAPGDAIVHDNKLTFFPGYYFDRELPQEFLADPEWSINDTFAPQTQQALGLFPVTLPEATAGKRRVFFVIFRQALEQATEQGRRQENKAWLDDHLRLVGEKDISDLIVYTYEPRG